MNCPVCGQTMEQGFLQTMNRAAWTKEIHKISYLPKRGEVLLANNMIKDVFFTAFICKECKKIVVDYSDKEIQENNSPNGVWG